jgi:hypothetical protein
MTQSEFQLDTKQTGGHNFHVRDHIQTRNPFAKFKNDPEVVERQDAAARLSRYLGQLANHKQVTQIAHPKLCFPKLN